MEDILKNLQNLTTQIEKIVEKQNEVYANLDDETFEKVKQHQVDINEMMRDLKSGNFLKLNKFVEKYADNNRK
jgi:peptidoglycan hydrolase CwlO-like protein